MKMKKTITIIFIILTMIFSSNTYIYAKNEGWVYKNNQWFYYENDQLCTGLLEIDEKLYYLDENNCGVMYSSKWKNVEGDWYYFSKNGNAVNGWNFINNQWYYFKENIMQKGLQKINNSYFYLEESKTNEGAMYANSWKKINSNWYFFDKDGYAVNGWNLIKNQWYYFKDNIMLTGLQKINNSYFYLEESKSNEGAMYSNTWKKIDSDWYYFNQGGYSTNGWKKINNLWYLFENSIMQTGLHFVDNHYYFLQSSGEMIGNKWKFIDDYWYFFDSTGASVNGLQYINGKYYYFKEFKMTTGLQEIDNKLYYFNEDGSMYIGFKNIDDNYYYFNPTAINGWIKINNKWYFFENYIMIKNQNKAIAEKEYYFNSAGIMQTGFVNIDSNTYYYNSSGEKVYGWKTINNLKYYFDIENNGAMTIGEKTIDGITYDFGENGYICSPGWQYINNNWYYYKENGQMAKEEWLKIDRHYYYFYSNGVMAVSTIIDGYKVGPTGIYIEETVDSNGITYVNGHIVANKKHALPSWYAPGENAEAVTQLKSLINDMRSQGYNIGTGYSGYRSYSYQKSLYDNYVAQYGQAQADTFSARPGYSEHQTGFAFDLTNTSGALVQSTAEANWLLNNAHRYGFIVRYQNGKENITGYQSEPWHLRYLGKDAVDVYNSKLSLEEYYMIQGGSNY